MDVVTSSDRPDLEDEARAGFRVRWPEFIVHDPISRSYIDRVEKHFPSYDVLLLDEGRVIADGSWTRVDGLSIDPWIRTHQRLGATILGPARRSMVITGSVAEWESWTEMVFPETGRYVVPDALGLVEIDLEADRETYVEDNLWMQHT